MDNVLSLVMIVAVALINFAVQRAAAEKKKKGNQKTDGTARRIVPDGAAGFERRTDTGTLAQTGERTAEYTAASANDVWDPNPSPSRREWPPTEFEIMDMFEWMPEQGPSAASAEFDAPPPGLLFALAPSEAADAYSRQDAAVPETLEETRRETVVAQVKAPDERISADRAPAAKTGPRLGFGDMLGQGLPQNLAYGILWSEILGAPRAIRPFTPLRQAGAGANVGECRRMSANDGECRRMESDALKGGFS